MEYRLSVEKFCESKMFDSNGKLHHNNGYRFRLFPFVARRPSLPLEGCSLAGSFLCRIEGKIPQKLTAASLVEKMKANTDIQIGQEQLFCETIRHLFFQANGEVKTLNLQLLEQKIYIEPDESRIADKIAEYLVDVLGDKNILRESLEKAKRKICSDSNVLEAFVLSKLEYDDIKPNKQEISYFRITNSLKAVFEDDFVYLLENSTRAGEDLITLLELYFFTYTAQACLQLDLFGNAKRDHNIPLYFCLEWEKTSQSRLCFTEGWQKLQRASEKMFAHVITLEILNQTENDSEQVDYIRLAEMAEQADEEIGTRIDQITDCYRGGISDSIDMKKLEKRILPQEATATAIRYLFDSVRTQFVDVRKGPYGKYADQYKSYSCDKFLKSRGRSGQMLNLSTVSAAATPGGRPGPMWRRR